MITYRGQEIPFGKHTDSARINAKKNIAFPGVNGIEIMPMGRREKPLQVSGRITNLSSGTFTKDTLAGWEDNDVGDLSIHGRNFPNTMLDSYTMQNFYTDKCTGEMCCEFTINFIHLNTGS